MFQQLKLFHRFDLAQMVKECGSILWRKKILSLIFDALIIPWEFICSKSIVTWAGGRRTSSLSKVALERCGSSSTSTYKHFWAQTEMDNDQSETKPKTSTLSKAGASQWQVSSLSPGGRTRWGACCPGAAWLAPPPPCWGTWSTRNPLTGLSTKVTKYKQLFNC